MSVSCSGREMWAGDNRGYLHSFSMAGTLKAVSQFDVGHTAMITGIHSSPGSLYTCSSDSTVKVTKALLLTGITNVADWTNVNYDWFYFRYIFRVHLQELYVHCSTEVE